MFEKTKAFLRSLRDDRRGNVLVLVGMSMVPLVGTLGLAVDASQWITWRRDLHSAADMGAMAGVQAMAAGQDVDAAVRKALGYNNNRTFTIEAIETPPTAGTYAGETNMVRVVLATSETLPFSSMFLSAAPTIRVEAVAESSKEVPNCMIALDTSGTALSIAGSSSVDMNCGLASNSILDATSSDSINAGALSAANYVNMGSAVTSTTAINDGMAVISDPMAGTVSDPNTGSCTSWPLVKGTTVLNAGCYKGIQVTNNSTLKLNPGTYYLGEKGLSVGGGATVTGSDVTLVFTNTDSPFNASKIGTFTGAGNSTITLTAPSSGTYAGVIMHQDSRATANNSTRMTITGDSASTFDGMIYAPSTEVQFTGNSGMTTDCLQIISQFITFTGNTSVANSCPAGRGVVAFNGTNIMRLRQ